MENQYLNGNENMSARGADAVKRFLEIWFRRRRLIVSVFFAVVALVTIVTFLLPPVYQATATILVERDTDSEKALLFRMNFPNQFEKYDWLKSEIEILQSYPVASRVVKKHRLTKINLADYPNMDVKTRQAFKRDVEKFQKKLNVELARDSNVISVGFQSEDPEQAALIANSVIDTYLAYRSEIYDASETYRFFEEQMRIADDKLRELEHKQAEFRRREHLVSSETQLEILLTKLADYEKTLTSVRTKRIGKEAKLRVIAEQMDRAAKDVSIPSTEVSDSPSREKYIARLKGELLDMEIRRDRLLQRFKPTYDEIREIEGDIQSTKHKIKDEITQIIREEETAIKALLAEEQALEQAIAAINREVADFAKKEYEMSQISRGIDDKREVYSMLLKQREEARLSLARLERGVKIKIISPAVIPGKPDKPRKTMNLVLGLILAAMASLGLAFFLEMKNRVINFSGEPEQAAGVPALGTVREH